MKIIGISIDMLGVGDADAIICCVQTSTAPIVIVIDGGKMGDGGKVINHLDKYIFPSIGKTAPDLIISTHPDRDHIGGLIRVVNHYGSKIKKVWVHNIKDHIKISEYRLLIETLTQNYVEGYQLLLESLNDLNTFIETVDRFGIPREQPFRGLNYAGLPIKVIGPSRDFYSKLLPNFRDLDSYLRNEVESERSILLEDTISLLMGTHRVDKRPCDYVDLSNKTSSENNSSVVIDITIDSKRFIFTGDAGVPAFEDINSNISLEGIFWLNVPHHGSIRNLSTKLIKTMKPTYAYISASGSQKHPRKELVDCLKFHGVKVKCTVGTDLWFHTSDFLPNREDYS